MKTNPIQYYHKIKKMQMQAWLLDKVADVKWFLISKKEQIQKLWK